MSKVLQTIVALSNEFGGNFVSVRNYTNEYGEVSNQQFNVGINYGKVLTDDLKTLQNFDTTELKGKFDAQTISDAYNEMLTSLENRTSDEATKDKLRAEGNTTILASDAQNNAYVTIAKGLRTQNNILYVYGLRTNKTILVEGDYGVKKNSVSRPKTLAKKEITKLAELRGANFRQYKLGGLETLKLKGITI
mgnify:CR=1 FL=1|tara:strand:- start:18 stop:593 length:576 start_codon:yes stop_codon:yes gene_type:complete